MRSRVEMVSRSGEGVAVNIKTGIEGPKYDLYSYTELSCTINNQKIKLHLGLAEYLEIDGKKHDGYKKEYEVCIRMTIEKWFEHLVGHTIESIEKENNYCSKICPKCGSEVVEADGYPGEIWMICSNESCHKIVKTYFNEEAIK